MCIIDVCTLSRFFMLPQKITLMSTLAARSGFNLLLDQSCMQQPLYMRGLGTPVHSSFSSKHGRFSSDISKSRGRTQSATGLRSFVSTPNHERVMSPQSRFELDCGRGLINKYVESVGGCANFLVT